YRFATHTHGVRQGLPIDTFVSLSLKCALAIVVNQPLGDLVSSLDRTGERHLLAAYFEMANELPTRRRQIDQRRVLGRAGKDADFCFRSHELCRRTELFFSSSQDGENLASGRYPRAFGAVFVRLLAAIAQKRGR